MDTFTAITYFTSSVSDVSECLPLIAWLLFVRTNKTYLWLGAFLAFSTPTKVFTLITAIFYINNMAAFHLLAAVEIVMIYCFYSRLMFNKINWGIVALLLAFNLGNTLFLQHIYTFNSIAWTVNMMILLVIGIIYLFRLYRLDDTTPLEQRPDFIITSGWLIYAAGSIFTYLLGTSILSGTAEGFYHNAWIFQCVCNILKNMIITYGLWRAR